MVNPSCVKCPSCVRMSVIPCCRMAAMEMQSVRLYSLSGRALYKAKPSSNRCRVCGSTVMEGIGKNTACLQGGGSAKLGGVTEGGEKLVQHLIGGDDLGVPEGLAQREGSNMPLVALVGKSDPVEGIGKDTPHAGGRFAVP